MVLWFAILSSKVSLEDDPESNYAAKLVKRGSSADAVNPLTGKNLLASYMPHKDRLSLW